MKTNQRFLTMATVTVLYLPPPPAATRADDLTLPPLTSPGSPAVINEEIAHMN